MATGERGGRRPLAVALPVALPAALALLLVSALAWHAVRSAQLHRRAVETALRDYAAFTAWQYARRASDYLRLRVISVLPAEGSVACAVRDGRVSVVGNETAVPDAELAAALGEGLRRERRSGVGIGLVPLGDARAHRYLGYWLRRPAYQAPVAACTARPVLEEELKAILHHVATFAPLLPPAPGGRPLPSDSLVSIAVLAADGARLAAFGPAVRGVVAADSLGPDLAGLRVVTTLHPAAAQRLVVGGAAGASVPALVAMLAATLALCAVALVQLRRSQQTVALRADFVAAVSHELRTPLTQISLFADTLASPRERGAAERQRYLGIISREARRLGQLVDSILHFAGMGAAGPLVAEPTLLGEALREVAAAFAPIADARGVSIDVRVEGEGEIELPLHRDAFRQLVLNVLDNALKYGPDGQRVLVSAALVGGRALVRVDDEGPGIPAREREAVFEPFVRVDRGGSRAGSGIGLAVVRDVARRHGGEVRALEAPGGGLRVEVELPGAAAAVAARA